MFKAVTATLETDENGVTYAVSAAAGRLEGSWKDISAPYSGSGITGTLATPLLTGAFRTLFFFIRFIPSLLTCSKGN